MSYTAGTVSARIELDTSDFDKEVKSLQAKIDNLKTVMSKNGLMDLDKQVTNLQNQLKKANETIADYKTQLKNLRDGHNNVTKSSKEHEKQEINLQKTIENTVKTINNETKGLLKPWTELGVTVKRSGVEIENAMSKFAGFKTTGKTTALKEYQKRLTGLTNAIKRLNSEESHYSQGSKVIIRDMSLQAKANENVINSFRKQQAFLKYIHTGYNQLTDSIVRTTQVLNTFNFKLLEGIDKESIFYKRTTQLASAMWALNSGVGTRGSATEYQGRQLVGGYSNYLSQISQVQTALNNAPTEKFKEQLIQLADALKKTGAEMNRFGAETNKVINNMSLMGRTNELVGELSKVSTSLNHFSNLSTKNRKALAQLSQQITIYRNKLNVLETAFKKGEITAQTYDAELSELAGKLKLVGSSAQQAIRELNLGNSALSKNTQNVRNAGRGLTSFNNGIVQTAHSGRILSNTLYQIRGALLSLKMIFTAMGGMALWSFATQIAEGVKETFKAKNEMEAQLKQNPKVSKGGLEYFENQLDVLTQKFKKVNKYSIGETVSSIGLEFNLSAKEMADFSDVVAMIQSEYVRAGRKESEAALAVKDILQGEFQRLSRETGVGKEELIAYGWNEDVKDIESLVDALRKAALDRNWDVFTAKATSLNDVLTITKSRFSEFGADLVQSVTPAIVGAFNTIIDTRQVFSDAWNRMGSFNRTFISMIGGGGLIGGLLTALPMITKGMGLAEISTIGWAKSLLTAALNLNKMEVAQYGVRKALAAVISGQKASELAETRWTKAIMGRVLGVNQAILAERGYKSALFHTRVALKEGIDLNKTQVNLEMGRAQKLAYMTNNLKLSEAAELSRNKAILRTIFSYKALKIAILGITTIGLASWYSGVAVQADLVKNRIKTFNEILETGSDKLNSAKKDLQTYTDQMAKYDSSTNEYKRAAANKKIIEGNIKELELSTQLAKSYDDQNKAREKAITEATKSFRKQALMEAGFSDSQATEKTLGYVDEINAAQYEITRSYNEQYNYLANSSKHLKENVKSMKEAKVSQEDMNKYIVEYSTVAAEAGEHLKQFYQGDVNALFAFGLDQLKLAWIDLWNNPHFINFWKQVQDTWTTIKPTLDWLVGKLQELGNVLLDLGAGFLSTDVGKWTASIAAAGTVIGLISLKIGKWISGKDSVVEVLKTVGSKLKDVADRWRNVGDEAEKANKKTGGDVSTGGVTGEKPPSNRKEWWTDTKGKLYQDATKYVRAATGIAVAMGLITEAIFLLKAPMWSLGEVGKDFISNKPNIENGVKAMKLVSDSLKYLLPFVPAFVGGLLLAEAIFESGPLGILLTGAAALGIAIGIGLVTEAILTLKAPLWAISELGKDYPNLDNVKNGADAIKVTSEALKHVGEAMTSLTVIDLNLLGQNIAKIVGDWFGINLGTNLTDLTKEGGVLDQLHQFVDDFNSTEFTIAKIDQAKVDNLALAGDGVKSIGDAMFKVKTAMDNLPPEFKNGGGQFAESSKLVYNSDADKQAGQVNDNAVSNYFDQFKEPIRQLKQFVDDFNKSDEFNIQQVNEDKLTNLEKAASMIKRVNSAVENVKKTMQNVGQAGHDTAFATGGWWGAAGFDIFHFTGPEAINNGTSSGDYKSSIGSSLKAMEDVIDDIFKFQSNVNAKAGSTDENANVDGATTMVTQIQEAISKLAKSLSEAVPTFEGKGNAISSALVKGIKDGMSNLGTDITTKVANAIDAAKPTAETYGKGLGWKVQNGFKTNLKLKDTLSTEVDNALNAINEDKKQEFYDKGKDLGDAFARGFKDGSGIHSPGYAAQAMQSEVGYIGQYLTNGLMNLPNLAGQLGTAISTNLTPSIDLSNFQFPDVSQWTAKLSAIPSAVNNVKTQVGTGFSNMSTTVGNSLSGIATNAKSKYSQIAANTRTSLTSMQSATIKNIGNIKTSWRGMQTALINSAETIRKQTGEKINNLKTNMGNFWKKIQNPSLLIQGSAGGLHNNGTIRRRSTPHIKTPNFGYAGGFSFRPKKSTSEPDDNVLEYIKCLIETGKPCYAGGWGFNWTKSIQSKLNGWNTHFSKYNLDNFLKVGKFYNNNFPVRQLAESARASIAKKYIYDTIAATKYKGYFDSNFGDDPVAALNAGSFNCWDGTNIILAIAKAFGFYGSRGHGTWNGIGHVWASIPGLGIIDPTAIQRGYGFTSPKVKGYAGAIPRKYASKGSGEKESVKTVTAELHIHGNVYGIDDLEDKVNRIAEKAARKINRKLYI